MLDQCVADVTHCVLGSLLCYLAGDNDEAKAPREAAQYVQTQT